MLKITIDTREQNRIQSATKYYESQGYQVKVSQEQTGDYIFNDQVVTDAHREPGAFSRGST